MTLVDFCSRDQTVRQDQSHKTKASREPLARHFLAIAFFLSLILGSFGHGVAGATAQDETSPGYATIDSAQLAAMFPDKAFFLVNVHIPYAGEIEGTDALVAFNRIAEQLDQFPSDKSATIVVYCQAGGMGEIAAAELARRGYTGISNLAGGMIGWKLSGNEILYK